ncbi:hypothetical protein [Spirosoma aureum]|nr:hypothetical protein [Spirosoma aureum]
MSKIRRSFTRAVAAQKTAILSFRKPSAMAMPRHVVNTIFPLRYSESGG